ncbi:MAG: hypothetical protein AAGC56_03195 [Pseudomonadota bacterium]
MTASSAPQRAFSPTLVFGLIAVGVFAFAAYFALAAYAPELRDRNDGGPHALSKGATGYAALAALLSRTGAPVLIPRGDDYDVGDGVVIYSPTDGQIFGARGVAVDGVAAALVVAPKWRTTPHLLHKGWVLKAGAMAPQALSVPAQGETFTVQLAYDKAVTQFVLSPSEALGARALGGESDGRLGSVDGLQHLVADDGLEPILVAENNAVVVGKLKSAPVYILADPDLLNTHGLSRKERAAFAVGFVDAIRGDGPVIFDLSLHGVTRTRNLLRLAIEPPFTAASLCALLATGLLAFGCAARFGPADRPAPAHEFGKAALAENSAALIRMAGRDGDFAARYVGVLRRRIAASIAAPASLSDADLDRIVDGLHGAQGAQKPFSALARELEQAETAADQIALADALSRQLKERRT